MILKYFDVDLLQDFITKCLEKDPRKRPTARLLLFHPVLFEVPALKVLCAHTFVKHASKQISLSLCTTLGALHMNITGNFQIPYLFEYYILWRQRLDRKIQLLHQKSIHEKFCFFYDFNTFISDVLPEVMTEEAYQSNFKPQNVIAEIVQKQGQNPVQFT